METSIFALVLKFDLILSLLFSLRSFLEIFDRVPPLILSAVTVCVVPIRVKH